MIAGETFDEAFARESREELNLVVDAQGWQVAANFNPLATPLGSFLRVYEVAFKGTPDLNPQEFSGGEWLPPGEVLARAAAGERVRGDLIGVIEQVSGRQRCCSPDV